MPNHPYGAVPEELRSRARWLNWVHKDGKKPPCDDAGYPLKGWRENLLTFEGAVMRLQTLPFPPDAPDSGGHPRAGIGLEGATGLDMDDCRNPETGDLDPRAQVVLDRVPGYAEVSPSGKGLKVFCSVTPPRWLEMNFSLPDSVTAVWKEPLYFAVTGKAVRDEEGAEVDGTEQLEWAAGLARAHQPPATAASPGPQAQGKATKGKPKKDRTAAIPQADGTIPPGQQDDWLRNRAWMWACRGLPFEDICGLLAIDARRCPASGAPWTITDFERLARSAADKAKSNPEDSFRRDGNGRILACEDNMAIALRLLDAEVRLDLFRRKTRMKREGKEVPYDDATIGRLRIDFENAFGFRTSAEDFYRYLAGIAHNRPFHPVREYLATLQWDGKERIGDWLSIYGRSESTVYTRAVGRLFLIAAVRRVLYPGAKYDEVLSLIGTQGIGKSTALQALCPDEDWFYGNLSLGMDSKQIIENTAGKWIVEVSDLKGFGQKDVDHVKSILSAQTDGPVRLAYGRESTEVPRQFVIAATTNVERFLRDQTGNRRFWPVNVGTMDVARIIQDRDQLWAEAALAEKEGASIRLAPELYGVAAAVQEDKLIDDPYVEVLEHILGGAVGKVTTRQLWERLEIPLERRNPWNLAGAMQTLGWVPRKIRDEAGVPRLRGYVRFPAGPGTTIDGRGQNVRDLEWIFGAPREQAENL